MEKIMDMRKAIEEAKVNLKRHMGVNLVGKYAMTDEQIEAKIKRFIQHMEIEIQALTEMLEQRDFH